MSSVHEVRVLPVSQKSNFSYRLKNSTIGTAFDISKTQSPEFPNLRKSKNNGKIPTVPFI